MNLINLYEKSFLLLNQYDEHRLPSIQGKKPLSMLDYDEAIKEISKLKQFLIAKKEASKLFGLEKDNSFKGIIKSIYQSFDGIDLLPTIEEKAANLLYYIVKDHPFIDGNKRIGAYLFIIFLNKNNYLYDTSYNLKINQNTLVTLTLLIALSNRKEKDLMIKLIMNLIHS